ncbi:alpha/beta-hydrolase [Polyplosphaeria fusca]|uniref:Feruloyl esterase C n=1 Tax=Polyplosphaeria fusca TaxID=682080 RepID=A0A9P4QQM8_9PLEO|nr:alpha/beta-hydrolase [Polyplosphaeria fusca]
MLTKFLNVALLLLGAATPIAAGKPSGGCGKKPTLISAGSATTPLNITAGGKSRPYYVKLPENYDNNHQYRLILTLHALGGSAQQVIQGANGWYGLPNLVKDNISAIYVAPQGTNANIGLGWWNSGGEDIAMIKDLIKIVEADVCIDQNLRFSTGFSHGGAMSFVLACAIPDQLRAVAVLSGNPQISGACPSPGDKPIAWYSEHGTRDQVLPIAGGREMRDRFIKNNGCQAKTAPEPARGEKSIKTVYNCTEGYPLTFVAFDGDHTPSPKDPGASKTFADTNTWEFFSQFK